ncbi:sugar nucleotide-binding protein [Guptibacillus algicola]|uniref:sugar nucleotide-binding protein n=1 Tax=Guptibacillus algicola TaxID=225844 RepID=UPI001CD29B2A|nr:sugar nucleotide-binding protein [Alkalihalobacillus algicola]MCA0987353.1 sugar nucleotide-binding protein [Alkalihalobacillus algicola]
MRILILGATGFLGSTVIQLASENKNISVFGTSRFPHENSTIIQVDVTTKESIRKAIKESNPEVVVWSLMSFEEEIHLINVGLKNVLSELTNDTKLIFLSTDGVFVEGKGEYSENDPIGMLPNEAPLAEYVNGKSIGENLIRQNHSNHIILRTGPLYGGNLNQSIEKRTLNMIERIKENKQIYAWEDVYRTFVNVTDLSCSILELPEMKYNGTLHVGPQDKVSYYSFFKNRLTELGWDTSLLSPSKVSKEEFPYLSIDTSLHTNKARQLLRTKFRSV